MDAQGARAGWEGACCCFGVVVTCARWIEMAHVLGS